MGEQTEKSTNEEGKTSMYYEAASAASAAVMLGSLLLSGCGKTDNSNSPSNENSKPAQSSIIANISTDNENLPYGLDAAQTPLDQKDLVIESIMGWQELSPIEEESQEQIFTTKEGAEVLLLPVKNDFFYNSDKEPSLWTLPEGISLQTRNIYSFTGENGKVIRLAILPNAMGANAIPIIVLDGGHIENDVYKAEAQSYVESDPNIIASYSYIVGKDEIYPNKINNVLTAMESIVKWQEENGMLRKGAEYSYLDLIGLRDFNKFKDGLTSSKAVVKGGGVCAGATLLSNLLYELSEESNIPWDDTVVEKWAHPSMYFVGPYSANDFITDATVQLSADQSQKSYDFRWVQPEDAYLKIDATIIPNGLSISETSSNGVGGPSDAQLILSISFTKNDPGNQSEKLMQLIADYESYRNSGNLDLLTSSLGAYNGTLSWEDPTLQVLAGYIYPEENVKEFDEEVWGEGYIGEIKKLQDVINSLPVGFSENLGDYLKTTDWYENLSDKEGIESALRSLNATKVENQPLQCVGFAILLAYLEKNELNVQDIGGAMSFGFGDHGARTAAELVPYKLLKDPYLNIAATGYGGIAFRAESIEDYVAGDLFVRADVGNLYNGETPEGEAFTYHTGHVGVILAKKVVNGETVLLVADANRENDGKIRIFEVNEGNFYKIFGDSQQSRYIIRSAANNNK